MRSGDLTPVAVPTGGDDALRERTRAREAALRDLKAATLRLNACRLRQEIRYTGRATWGPPQRRWRSEVVRAPRRNSASSQKTSGGSMHRPHACGV